ESGGNFIGATPGAQGRHGDPAPVVVVAVDPIEDMALELLTHGADAVLVRRVAGVVRARWGGAEIYIAAIDRASRDEAARAALDRGASILEAAKEAGCSPSTVRRRRSRWLS
ncbi:MAG: hypothetical protein EOM91_22205, partial [Sphingobacteriia bacterium]|nr:hypothetical protein [Sphingobacteriia bacterium]